MRSSPEFLHRLMRWLSGSAEDPSPQPLPPPPPPRFREISAPPFRPGDFDDLSTDPAPETASGRTMVPAPPRLRRPISPSVYDLFGEDELDSMGA